MAFHRTANPDSHWYRPTSDSEMAASPTSTTPTSPATRASTRYFRCSAGMLLKRQRHAIRALGLTYFTMQAAPPTARVPRSEEHTSELQSQSNLVCRLLLEKKKQSADE